MSKTFYSIHRGISSAVLVPVDSHHEIKSGTGGSFYYEYEDCDDHGDFIRKVVVYPSKADAWEQVKTTLMAEIASRQRFLDAVTLACAGDKDKAFSS